MQILEQLKEKLHKDEIYRIVFMGDSITSHEWVHPNWHEIIEYVLKFGLDSEFENEYQTHWNIRTLTMGFNGGNTDMYLERIDEELERFLPDLVFCNDSCNDITSGFTVEQHVENVKKLKDKLSQISESFVFMTDMISGHGEEPAYLPYLEPVRQVAQKENEIFVDFFKEFENVDVDRFFSLELPDFELNGNPKGSVDNVHPNALGNAYIAKVLLKRVFDIDFDPEQYLEDIRVGKKYPIYQ